MKLDSAFILKSHLNREICWYAITEHNINSNGKEGKGKVKQSRYTPWRRLRGEEV
jgi:hypothetical protein